MFFNLLHYIFDVFNANKVNVKETNLLFFEFYDDHNEIYFAMSNDVEKFLIEISAVL